MLYRFTIALLFFFASLVSHAELLTFNKENNSVTILKEKLNIIDFLVELESQSDITIQCDPSVKPIFELPKTTLTLQQVLRALDKQYSTIQGLNSAGKVISLDVLPPGDGSAEKQNAVPVKQLHQKKLQEKISDKKSEAVPAYIDLNNVTDSDWESLNTEQKKALREALREKRAVERKEKFDNKRKQHSDEIRKMLEKIQQEQPELYPIYLEQYKGMLAPDNAGTNSDD